MKNHSHKSFIQKEVSFGRELITSFNSKICYIYIYGKYAKTHNSLFSSLLFSSHVFNSSISHIILLLPFSPK